MQGARQIQVQWTRSTLRVAQIATLLILALMVLAGAGWLPVAANVYGTLIYFLGALVGFHGVRRGWRVRRAGSFRIEKGALQLQAARARWSLRGETLVGASSSRGERGWDLTLQSRGDAPITLKGLSEDDVQQICEVLGIGAAGFGELSLRSEGSPGRFFLAGACGLFGVGLLGVASVGSLIAYATWAVLVCLGFVATSMFSRQTACTLSDAGIGLQYLGRHVVLPWHQLAGVQRLSHVLNLYVSGQPFPFAVPIQRAGGFISGGLTPTDADLVQQQAEAALERARGKGRPRKIDATGTSEMLARQDRPTHEWYAYLDALAADMLHGGGYRGVHLDPNVLHEVLRNPDAEASVRAGAARILARIEGDRVRERIEIAVGSLHDEADILTFEEALQEPLQAAAPRALR